MKSSKGKVPVGGKTKKVTMAAHGARKQKEKDPVEVRTTHTAFFPPSEISLSYLVVLDPGLLQSAAVEGGRRGVVYDGRERKPSTDRSSRELSGLQIRTEEPC